MVSQTTNRANSSPPCLNSRTQTTRKHDAVSDTTGEMNQQELLTCRVLGFYPFPTPPPKGPVGWLLRDTHQAIIVRSSASPEKRILMDFMTEGGEFHPVWFDEGVKWSVFLGGSIRGEVRVRFLDGKEESVQSPKLEKLLKIARSYDCDMNLYRNNCRVFCAEMEREVDLLNSEDSEQATTEKIKYENTGISSAVSVDIRYTIRVVGARLLATLYPLSVLWLFYEGFHDVFEACTLHR